MDEKKLSSSWHESGITVKPTHPQLLLYKAVFSNGIKDYLMPDTPGRRAWAIDWIFDDESTEHFPGSFAWYCARLVISPVKVKMRLVQPDQIAELKRIFSEGVKVDELIIQFLKGDGIIRPKPVEPPRKQVLKRDRLPLWPTDTEDSEP